MPSPTLPALLARSSRHQPPTSRSTTTKHFQMAEQVECALIRHIRRSTWRIRYGLQPGLLPYYILNSPTDLIEEALEGVTCHMLELYQIWRSDTTNRVATDRTWTHLFQRIQDRMDEIEPMNNEAAEAASESEESVEIESEDEEEFLEFDDPDYLHSVEHAAFSSGLAYSALSSDQVRSSTPQSDAENIPPPSPSDSALPLLYPEQRQFGTSAIPHGFVAMSPNGWSRHLRITALEHDIQTELSWIEIERSSRLRTERLERRALERRAQDMRAELERAEGQLERLRGLDEMVAQRAEALEKQAEEVKRAIQAAEEDTRGRAWFPAMEFR